MRWDPERALAAVVAASDTRFNYARIALMYGEDATMSAIEYRFRSIRRVAETLRNNANGDNSNPGATPRSNSRPGRSILPRDTPETPTPRSGRKRSAKKGGSTTKSPKSTDDIRDAICIDDSDEDEKSNTTIKRVKRETISPTPRNQLPDINTRRTALFDSTVNGYKLFPTETTTQDPEQDESEKSSEMIGGDYAYGFFDEA